MSLNATLTGKPSIDKPWLKYYPKILMDNLQVPVCTLTQYLQFNMPGLDVPAMHYYGTDITWAEVFEKTERIAKSLKALGLGEGDQIPVFLRSVPEFIPMLLAIEKIGASLLIRDNEIFENAQAMKSAGSKVLFPHSFLPQSAMDEYVATTDVRTFILMDPCTSCKYRNIPDYVQKSLDANYNTKCAGGEMTMTWSENLPILVQWRSMASGDYALGLEPTNCYIMGRHAERENGTLPVLKPFESVTTGVNFSFRSV